MNEPPAPTMSEVLVHGWRVADKWPDPDALALLDAAERERLSHITHPLQAAQFAAGRAGARGILSRLLQVSPHDIRFGRATCPECGSHHHGPPVIDHPKTPFRISLSHSEGYCLFAIARVPVGVDVEGVREMDTEELGRIALTPAERRHVRAFPPGRARHRAFLRCWTRKEAVLKAVGTGITGDLTTVETRPDVPGPATVTAGVAGTPGTWTLSDLATPGEWVATVAVPSRVPMTVRLHRPSAVSFSISSDHNQ
ncbi:4'-phosphopantetheinyl transferase superfamily protein [Streptomyces sp. NPDC006435]|uniref:4'-phosphopantetheinyl transferase family protein n=1 Tax=Streptomyces sp. NPDC006435 TaxID=3154300 RepID=UPI0033BC413C